MYIVECEFGFGPHSLMAGRVEAHQRHRCARRIQRPPRCRHDGTKASFPWCLGHLRRLDRPQDLRTMLRPSENRPRHAPVSESRVATGPTTGSTTGVVKEQPMGAFVRVPNFVPTGHMGRDVEDPLRRWRVWVRPRKLVVMTTWRSTTADAGPCTMVSPRCLRITWRCPGRLHAHAVTPATTILRGDGVSTPQRGIHSPKRATAASYAPHRRLVTGSP